MRLELDETADRRRGILAHGEAHALRRIGEPPVAIDAMNAYRYAIAALPLLADFDEAGQRHARCREPQNRMRDDFGAQRGCRKAGGNGGKAECERKANRAPTRHDRTGAGRQHEGGRRPPRRLAIGCEVDDDAEAMATASQGISRPGTTSAIIPCDTIRPSHAARPASPSGSIKPARRRAPSTSAAQALARVPRCPLSAMAQRSPTLTQLQPEATLQQPQVAARGTVVNLHALTLRCGGNDPALKWLREPLFPSPRCRAARWCE